MNDEGEAVRIDGMDAIHKHLRKQDDDIVALNRRLDGFQEALMFIVAINQNLKGFSEFCCRWGRRFNRACKWTATVIAPIVTLYILCKDQIDALIKKWFD